MRKTKLLTSIAALALVLGLGACNETEEGPKKTVLGAADPETGVYYYFNGEAATTSSSHFLAVTTSWDEAADVSIDDLEEGGQSLSFVDAEGVTKYISWSDGTAVDIADEPFAWYWVEDNGVYAAGSEDGRGLLYYADNPSFRAYSQTDQFLAYGHVAAYTEEPEGATPAAPAEPEPATAIKLEEVTSLENGKEYYLGSWTNETTYSLYNGSFTSNGYNLNCTQEATEAKTVKVTGSSDAWKVTLADDSTLYGYLSTTNYCDFGSYTDTLPEGGVDTFTWNSTLNTLNTTSVLRDGSSESKTYTYSYFEFYQNQVCLYSAEADANITNAAHFYTVAA